jgi:MFS family permease
LNGFFVLGLAYSGCNLIAAVVFFTLSVAIHGGVSTAYLASIVDIAPNFAGVVFGVVCTISVPTGYISTVVVGYFTFGNQTAAAWRHIFEICAATLVGCGVIYIWLNDTAIQLWNNLENKSEGSPLATEKQLEKPPEEETVTESHKTTCFDSKLQKKSREIPKNLEETCLTTRI